jgi:hypothetical protein
MRSEILRYIRLLFVSAFVFSSGTIHANANNFVELGADTIFEILKKLVTDASSLREALDKINEGVKLSLPSSMVDADALTNLSNDVLQLNRLVPSPLPSINNMDSIRRIAAGSKNRGTLLGSSEELQRLEGAARKRQTEIDGLNRARGNLKSLKDTYAATADSARTLSDKIAKLSSNPTIEFFSRLSGKSVALSWADLETELVPALQERQSAAERAIERLNPVISSAETDLKGFNDARMFAAALFSETPVNGSATGLGASGVPGTVSAKLALIEKNMRDGTADSLKLADKMRDEANAIREHNANISKYQLMLKVITFGLAAGGDHLRDPRASKDKPVTVIYLKTEKKWTINIPPTTPEIRRH